MRIIVTHSDGDVAEYEVSAVEIEAMPDRPLLIRPSISGLSLRLENPADSLQFEDKPATVPGFYWGQPIHER